MYTDAEDWLKRFKAAGCTLRVDAANIRPLEGVPISPECMVIWDEIRGVDNQQRWDEVTAEVRARVGPITSWVDY